MVAAVVMLSIILVKPPCIGMEDNGEFLGRMREAGLHPMALGQEEQDVGYFVKDYRIMQYYNEADSVVVTSHQLFIKIAVVLDRMFTGSDGRFDIRFFSILMIIYSAVILYLLVDYVSYRISIVYAYIMGIVSLYLFVDTGYTAYFNSFYPEGLAMVSLLGCLVCGLLFVEKRYNRFVMLIGFFINGLIFICSDLSFAPLGIILGLLAIYFVVIYKDWITRVIVLMAAMGILLTSIIVSTTPSRTALVNHYHTMTRGILQSADNPEEALESFNIDQQFALLSKTSYYQDFPEIDIKDDLLGDNFYTHYRPLNIIGYYILHPAQFFEMLHGSLIHAYGFRPELGNYEHSTGRAPKEKATLFAYHSTVKKAIVPGTVGFVIIWILAVLIAQHKHRGRQMVTLAAILIGLLCLTLPVLVSGNTVLSKPFIIYNVVFDFVNYLLLTTFVIYLDSKRRRPRHAKPREVVA